MSEERLQFQQDFKAAQVEYATRVRKMALFIVPIGVIAFWVLDQWSGKQGALLITALMLVSGLLVNRHQRKIWRDLQIKHGLIND